MMTKEEYLEICSKARIQTWAGNSLLVTNITQDQLSKLIDLAGVQLGFPIPEKDSKIIPIIYKRPAKV